MIEKVKKSELWGPRPGRAKGDVLQRNFILLVGLACLLVVAGTVWMKRQEALNHVSPGSIETAAGKN